jgi:CBS domain-containing protein
MTIGDIMSRPAVVCRPGDTLEDAARLMWECDCGVVPVVDEDNRVAGMVTDRDICMAAYTKGKTLGALKVSEAMARNVCTCRQDDTVESAERLMRNRQVRRLPVVDREGHPIGIVSIGDIARLATAGQPRGERVEREVAQSLAEISRPRQTLQSGGRPGTIVL